MDLRISPWQLDYSATVRKFSGISWNNSHHMKFPKHFLFFPFPFFFSFLLILSPPQSSYILIKDSKSNLFQDLSSSIQIYLLLFGIPGIIMSLRMYTFLFSFIQWHMLKHNSLGLLVFLYFLSFPIISFSLIYCAFCLARILALDLISQSPELGWPWQLYPHIWNTLGYH